MIHHGDIYLLSWQFFTFLSFHLLLLNFLPSFPSFTLLIFPSFSSAQSLCLSDEPRAVKEYRYPEQLPGELYDADTQCKWQFGEKAKLCTLDFKKVEVTRARTLTQNKQSKRPRAEWDEWGREKNERVKKKKRKEGRLINSLFSHTHKINRVITLPV